MKSRLLKNLIALMCIGLIIGGCKVRNTPETHAPGSVKNRVYSQEEITEGGIINLKKAEYSGYVLYEETVNSMFNSKNDKAKNYVLESEAEILKDGKVSVSKMVGRDVEIVGFSTPFPYMAVNLHYKTTDFPVIYGTTTLGLESSVAFVSGGYKEISKDEIIRKTVAALFSYAYEEELNTLREHIKVEFPEYISFAQGTQSGDITGSAQEFITIETDANSDQEAMLEEMFDAQLNNPKISREELRILFESKYPYYLMLRYKGILKDETVVPTKEMANKILEELQKYDLGIDNIAIEIPVLIDSSFREKESGERLVRVEVMERGKGING